MMQSNSEDSRAGVYNIEILNIFNLELQLIHNKPVIENQLKGLLGELKSIKNPNIISLEE